VASFGRSWAFDFFLGISSGWDFFEMSEKIWGHVAGEGNSKIEGKSPRGPPKGPKNFEKIEKGMGPAMVQHFSLWVAWR